MVGMIYYYYSFYLSIIYDIKSLKIKLLIDFILAKDENVRRIMKEIEHLSEDCSKLQQLLELSSSLRCPHQTLEESIRDLQVNVQRQLVERQANDSQLNVLELNLNAP